MDSASRLEAMREAEDYARYLAARDTPAECFWAACGFDVGDDTWHVDVDAMLRSAPGTVPDFGRMSEPRREAEACRRMAEEWLRRLEAGDWCANEAFKLRWDLWEYLADVRGVTLPEPDPSWTMDNPAPRSTVNRRLRKLGVTRGGPGCRRLNAGRKPAQ